MSIRDLYDAACEVGEQDEPPTAKCPACSAINYAAGTLGNTPNFNCRACGLWYWYGAIEEEST